MTAGLRALFAIDGSESSTAMIRCWSAWRGAARNALQAHLLTVVPPPLHVWPTSGFDPGLIDDALRSAGRERLADAERLMQEGGVPWESAVRIGAPAETIVAEARGEGAEIIVMGTRGLSALRGLLVGSVALRVVQASPVPVWLMPPKSPCPQAMGRRLRLLVAADGSDAANAAAAWAARAAAWFGDVHVELLSVQPPFSPLEGMIDATAGRFDHWSQRIGRAAIDGARDAMGETQARIETNVCTGETVATIAARADEIEADAIVVGPRGLGTVGQALLGSVTSGLLQTSRRAVIVVPRGAQ